MNDIFRDFITFLDTVKCKISIADTCIRTHFSLALSLLVGENKRVYFYAKADHFDHWEIKSVQHIRVRTKDNQYVLLSVSIQDVFTDVDTFKEFLHGTKYGEDEMGLYLDVEHKNTNLPTN